MVLTQVLKSVVDVPTFDIDRPQFDAWWTGEFAGATLAFDFTTGRAMINNSNSTIDQLLTGTYTLDSSGLNISATDVALADMSFLTQGIGTIYAETEYAKADTAARGIFALTGPGTTYIRGYFRGSSDTMGYQIANNPTLVVDLKLTLAYPGDGIQKMSYTWQDNNANHAVNGNADTEDTSCTIPLTIDGMRLGGGTDLSALNGILRKFAYYPIHILEAEQEADTA